MSPCSFFRSAAKTSSVRWGHPGPWEISKPQFLKAPNECANTLQVCHAGSHTPLTQTAWAKWPYTMDLSSPLFALFSIRIGKWHQRAQWRQGCSFHFSCFKWQRNRLKPSVWYRFPVWLHLHNISANRNQFSRNVRCKWTVYLNAHSGISL